MAINSLFDPNNTGTGHQPYGFDQLATLYAKYRVDRVRIELLFTTPGASADMCCVAEIEPVASLSTTAATIDEVCERSNVLHEHLSSSGQRTARITKDITMWELLGVSQAKYISEGAYSAVVGANPSSLSLLRLNVCSYSGAGGQAASLQCILYFESHFYDRTTLAQS